MKRPRHTKERNVPHRLRIFISSTSDLKAERDAVESVLAEMDRAHWLSVIYALTKRHSITTPFTS
jgi:hypothetical protein